MDLIHKTLAVTAFCLLLSTLAGCGEATPLESRIGNSLNFYEDLGSKGGRVAAMIAEELRHATPDTLSRPQLGIVSISDFADSSPEYVQVVVYWIEDTPTVTDCLLEFSDGSLRCSLDSYDLKANADNMEGVVFSITTNFDAEDQDAWSLLRRNWNQSNVAITLFSSGVPVARSSGIYWSGDAPR